MQRVILLAALLALGCGEDVDEEGARALWEKIHAESYPDWQRAPGYDEPQPTVRAHGQTALVYLNDVMAEAAAGPSIAAWPAGALLVKDSFDGDTLKFVAAMEKTEDSGWFFAEWSPDGSAKYAGEPEVCVNCHSAGGDSVLAVALP
jgi:hypothetical protein